MLSDADDLMEVYILPLGDEPNASCALCCPSPERLVDALIDGTLVVCISCLLRIRRHGNDASGAPSMHIAH